jgi:AAA+ ATPase superfamily predicted ATPase
MPFFNRKSELETLQRHLSSGNSELIIIEGRRRVGKTELIKHLLSSHGEGIYFFVNITERKLELDEFSNAIARQTGEVVRFETPAQLYGYLVERSAKAKKKLIVVFDEFQRFDEVDRGFVTSLQDAWDSGFKDNGRAMIILAGSSVSMMRRLTRKSGAPLFGRKTAYFHMKPFEYFHFRQAFKEFSEEEKIRAYSIFGGTPHYFVHLDNSKNPDFKNEIRRMMLEPDAPLRDEPNGIFYKEGKWSVRYNAILQAIAEGNRTATDIANYVSSQVQSKVRPESLSPYLRILIEQLDILERDEPIFGKSKHGRYRFSDPFFEFWFKFVFPNQDALELGNFPAVEKLISEKLPALEGRVFERICRQFLKIHNNGKIKDLRLNLTALGGWWTRKAQVPESTGPLEAVEIDIVAKNDDSLLLGEVSYSNKPMDYQDLRNLVESKSRRMNHPGKFEFILFSKSGYTKECQDYAEKIGCTTLDLKEMTRIYDKFEN